MLKENIDIMKEIYQQEETNTIQAISYIKQQQKIINPTQDLKIIEKIGSGKSKLNKVVIKKFYVLKEVDIQNPNSESLQRLIDEFKIMKMLHHLNIHKAKDLFINDEKLPPSILLEYCPVSLEEAIESKILTDVQKIYAIYQIAEGMRYIHSRNIAHRNLKPSSILITNDVIIKISNFENAQSFTNNNEEQLKEINNDIYSFGSIVYYILCDGKVPDVKDESALSSLPLLAQQLIDACWSDDIESKPTFDIICDVLIENNFNLIALSQNDIQDVKELVREYKEQIPNY